MRQTEVEQKLSEFTARQNWMHNIGLPGGLYTTSKSRRILSLDDDHERRASKLEMLRKTGAKEGLLCAMDLKAARARVFSPSWRGETEEAQDERS